MSCDIHTTITGISVVHQTRTVNYRDTSKHKYITYYIFSMIAPDNTCKVKMNIYVQ